MSSPPHCSRPGLPPACSRARACPWGLHIGWAPAQKVSLSHPRRPGSFLLIRSWLSSLLLCEAFAEHPSQHGLQHPPSPSPSPHPDIFLQSTLLSDTLCFFIALFICCLLSPLWKQSRIQAGSCVLVPCCILIAKMPPDTEQELNRHLLNLLVRLPLYTKSPVTGSFHNDMTSI